MHQCLETVLTALDNIGGVAGRMLSGIGETEAALAGWIAPDTVLCGGGAQAYLCAAKATGAKHRRVIVPIITPHAIEAAPLPTKLRKTGRLGRVDAHHGQLKVLVNEQSRSVATHYLGCGLSSPGRRCWINRSGIVIRQRLTILMRG